MKSPAIKRGKAQRLLLQIAVLLCVFLFGNAAVAVSSALSDLAVIETQPLVDAEKCTDYDEQFFFLGQSPIDAALLYADTHCVVYRYLPEPHCYSAHPPRAPPLFSDIP